MAKYSIKSIFSDSLKREVKVFIYKPKNYSKSDVHYPVLYMHDGHNLFDNKTATFGKSWGIVESYENDLTLPEVIIVGIKTENPERLNELSPYKFSFQNEKVGGLANEYYEFVINELKPIIDDEYRTLPNSHNTAVMGSSLGGVSSAYAAIKYNDTFTRFGCVSSAFFINYEEIKHEIYQNDLLNVSKLYLDVGTKESLNDEVQQQYIESNKGIYVAFKSKLNDNKIKFEIIEDATHSEKTWEKRFPLIIKYLFSDYCSV